MKAISNDRGERVMIPDDLGTLERVNILYPATIKTVKERIKLKDTLGAIKMVAGYKLTSEEKTKLLFIASGNRLVRKF